MLKEFQKSILKRPRLRSIFLIYWTNTNKNITTLKEIFLKKSWEALKNHIFKILTLEKSLITEVSGSFHYLPKTHQKVRKNLVDDGKSCQVARISAKNLINCFLTGLSNLIKPKPKFFPMVFKNLEPIMPIIKSFEKHIFQLFLSTLHFRYTSCCNVEKSITNINVKES